MAHEDAAHQMTKSLSGHRNAIETMYYMLAYLVDNCHDRFCLKLTSLWYCSYGYLVYSSSQSYLTATVEYTLYNVLLPSTDTIIYLMLPCVDVYFIFCSHTIHVHIVQYCVNITTINNFVFKKLQT